MESDGVDEALVGLTNVVLTAASRVGEQLARAREQELRAAQARSEASARALQERFLAERAAARASLAVVHRDDWWSTATREEVVNSYTTARAWSHVDEQAARAEERITYEVQQRYGVDVRDVEGREPGALGAALQDAERVRAEAAEQRGTGAQEQGEAAGVMAAADAVDAAAAADQSEPGEVGQAEQLRESGEQLYDSAERREEMAAGMDGVADRETVAARVRADVAQGRPASEAVNRPPARAPKARRSRTQGVSTQKVLERGR